MNNNCNLITCRYNENGKCTNEEKRKCCESSSQISPSELFMYIGNGTGNTATLKRYGIEIDADVFGTNKARKRMRRKGVV